ncbi:MAG: hypothetical protein PF448_06255 [Bacteroidales bacterium]|jgi:hypothetical protein|nr:hypothetical protein [Bacteroidales bacterium]
MNEKSKTIKNNQAMELLKFIEENVTVKKDQAHLKSVIEQVIELPEIVKAKINDGGLLDAIEVLTEFGRFVKITEFRLALLGLTPEARIIAETSSFRVFNELIQNIVDVAGEDIIEALFSKFAIWDEGESEESTRIIIDDVNKKTIVNLESYRKIEITENLDSPNDAKIECVTPSGSVDTFNVKSPSLFIKGTYVTTDEFDKAEQAESEKAQKSERDKETKAED